MTTGVPAGEDSFRPAARTVLLGFLADEEAVEAEASMRSAHHGGTDNRIRTAGETTMAAGGSGSVARTSLTASATSGAPRTDVTRLQSK